MSPLRCAAAFLLAGAAAPALAGPPYLTDDPVPTDVGHWEIYTFTAGERFGRSLEDETGVDLNFGAVKDIQLTSTLPLGLSHELSDWRAGTGDVELGVKYRFLADERAGVSAAVFPRAILPTSSIVTGERTRFLLPLWLEKDFSGGTSLFGGGGYTINPGAGNRDFWQAGITLTHDLNTKVSVGAELTRQGAGVIGGTAQTRAGAGAIIRLAGPYSLLFSGGPTWTDRKTGYHFYGALGLNF